MSGWTRFKSRLTLDCSARSLWYILLWKPLIFLAAFLFMNLSLFCSPRQNRGFLKTSMSLSCLTLWKSYILSCMGEKNTCLTKEEKFECLKYLGSISFVNATTSMTANPISSLSQQMIFLFSGCSIYSEIPLEFNMFWGGMRQWCHCSGHCCFYVGAPAAYIINNRLESWQSWAWISESPKNHS